MAGYAEIYRAIGQPSANLRYLKEQVSFVMYDNALATLSNGAASAEAKAFANSVVSNTALWADRAMLAVLQAANEQSAAHVDNLLGDSPFQVADNQVKPYVDAAYAAFVP